MANVNVVSENSKKLSASELVDKGLIAHQKGDLDSAACLYQAAIEQDNQQSDALHLLGMIAFQLEQADKAEQLILLAIKNNPEVPVYFNNLGNLYLSNGSIELAVEAYQRAVRLKEDYTEAKFNLANAYVEFDDYGLAEIFYLRALETTPEFTPALKNLGELYVIQNKWSEALICYENLNAMEPANEEYAQRLSDLLVVVGAETENSLENIHKALELDPENIDARLALANHHINNASYADAEILYSQVLEQDSENPEALFGMATLCKQNNELERAVSLYERAIDANPTYIEALFNLGNTLKVLGELDNAVSAYEKILSVDSNHVGAMVNLAVIFAWQGGFADALILLKSAEVLESDNFILQNNLGMVHHLLRNYDEAKKHYQKAITLDDNPEAKWNLSLTLLSEGNFSEGFPMFESRWELPALMGAVKRDFNFLQWKGENLNQKTLLIHSEQGYGDVIQFARLIPVLVEKGADIVLEVPAPLQKIMKTLDPAVQVVTSVSNDTAFDYHCSIMSLPAYMNFSLQTIPGSVPYLKVAVENERPVISRPDSLKVGVVWWGNPRKHDVQTNMVDLRRSCDLAYFESLTDVDGISFYSLQFGKTPGSKSNIIDVMSKVDNFYETAEIIQQLDLVVSVDTAVAHLAGALNKPVWLLSRYDACWRWLNNREDSPWYPSMRIFRQREPGDWRSVFDEVKKGLRRF